MMEEKDGTGDGECGNGIWWKSRPVLGGALVAGTLEEPAVTEEPAVIVDEATGDGSTSEMVGPDADNAGNLVYHRIQEACIAAAAAPNGADATAQCAPGAAARSQANVLRRPLDEGRCR
jgi:hypothetical protein